MGIPLIDLTDALTPGAPRSAEVAREFRAAAMASGFFYVRHHGVDADRVTRQFDIARRLMDLPAERREALSIRRSPI
ncbi:MAG TPA: 2-oxoglutarate and iron-dependent oxygenase domain-containing protein, partial [Variovorax sp.]|nr:2-oxoglutarate and iron-dependent oxygenase domain-containing protein [Variovorax sp.]